MSYQTRAESAPNSTSIVLRGEIRAGSDGGRRGESTSRTLTPRVLNASFAERRSSRLSSTGCRHHTRFEGEFQRTAQRWGRIIEAWTKGPRGPAPDRLRPVLLKQEDPLGEVKVLAALLAAETGHSHEQAVYALLEEKGEIRRQNVRGVRRAEAPPLRGVRSRIGAAEVRVRDTRRPGNTWPAPA